MLLHNYFYFVLCLDCICFGKGFVLHRKIAIEKITVFYNFNNGSNNNSNVNDNIKIKDSIFLIRITEFEVLRTVKNT